MALQKQPVQISLSGGIDTKSDEKLVAQTNLTELENGVFNKGSTITKRYGYSALSPNVVGGTALTSGDGLLTFEDELFLTASNTFYSFAPSREAWLSKGSFRALLPSLKDVVRNNSTQTVPDIAIYNRMAVIAWEDTSDNGIHSAVIDLENNVFLMRDTVVIATGTNPRCVKVNESLFVFYAVGGSTELNCKKLNLDTLAYGAEITISSGLQSTNLYEVVEGDGTAFFAYHSASTAVTVGYLMESGVIGSPAYGFISPTAHTIAAPTNCLDVVANADKSKYYVAYRNASAGLKLISFLPNLTVDLSDRVIDSTTTVNNVTQIFDSSSNLNLLYEISASNTYDHYIKTNTVTIASSTTGTPSVVKRSVGLASKAFMQGSTIYINVVHESGLQSTYFTMTSGGLLTAKFALGEASGLPAKNILPTFQEDETDIFISAAPVRTELKSSSDGVYATTGITRVKLDFSSGDINFAELGGNLHVYGGFLNMYDGNSIVEHGFHLSPENITSSFGTSGSMANGAYNYKVIYSWKDHKGQIHYSAPSVVKTITTTGGNDQVNIIVPSLRLTQKTDVKIRVYRTEATKSTLYYFTAEADNSTTTDSVTIADTSADATIISNEFLYTNGGILGNIAPPSGNVIGVYKNRVFVVSGEDQKTVYFSKARSKGLPVEFSETLRVTLSDADTITALADMDGKLFIFEQSRIFMMSGDGPTNTGVQDNFTKPQLITSDVGCSNTNSIVSTPKGLMFQSTKGLYLLDRALKTQYLGSDVETYNSLTVKGATLVQDSNQVRFLTSDDKTLVYDYFYDKWSVFTNHYGNGSVLWQGLYTYLRTDGRVYKENTDYLDDKRAITMRITTAWINLGQFQGFQRIYKSIVLGDFKTKHVMICQIAYDYEPFFNEEHKFDFGTAKNYEVYGEASPYGDGKYGGDSDGVYQFRIQHTKQKCQSFRIRFFDSMPVETSQSFSISILQSMIGMKKGLRKLGTISTV